MSTARVLRKNYRQKLQASGLKFTNSRQSSHSAEERLQPIASLNHVQLIHKTSLILNRTITQRTIYYH